MFRVGDDYLAVVELDCVAGAAVHDLGGGDDLAGLAVGAARRVPVADLAHRAPPGRGRQRRVQREGVADGGAGGYDDHLAGVQAVGEGVQVGEAGGDAGEDAAAAADGLDLVQGARHDLRQRVVVLAPAAVGDGEYLGLGPVHEVVGVGVAGVAELDDPGARLHQAAQDGALPDDAGVVAGVGRGRHRGDQGVQVDAAADRKSTRLNSSHVEISYAVFCLKKKNNMQSTKN